VSEPELPAWSVQRAQSERVAPGWPSRVTRELAWGGSTGAGVRVCIVDSGIDRSHPSVGDVARAVTLDGDRVVDDTEGDVSGHGTACAGIIRALAPDCELSSVRVLGAQLTGAGSTFLAGLAWAVEQRFQVVNPSLSTRKRVYADELRELADRAYFGRTILVASAHNVAVESYPWRFSSVVSVGSHEGADPLEFHFNPRPPVEFFARGVDVAVAWPGGGEITASGNSFATPHVAAVCALILGKHPELTPFQVKSLLSLTATNVQEGR
jgi:subtilisin